MTFELLFYFIILFVGLIVCITRVNDTFYNIGSLTLFVFFSLIVRSAGFDADIGNYAEYLKINSFSIYYIKEGVYWLGSRVIYDFTDSEIIVFITYDIVFFSLLLVVRSRLALPKYFPYLVILFFPTVMGMQNVFRQFIASGFLLLFFAQVMTSQKMLIKVLTFILAGFSHNVAFLFLPILFLKSKSRKVSLLFLGSSISILVLLPIAAASKSNSVTGEVPAYMFVVLFSLMVLGYLAVFNFKFKNRPPVFTQFFYLLLFCYALIIEASAVLGSAQSKRLGMMSLIVCLIPLVMSIEVRFKQNILVRLLFLIMLTAPTLLFQNAFSLLQTTEESLKVEAVARSQSHKRAH
ncbi:MAG: hypothetical protein ACJAS9_002459 [Polaribacter sp.]|jgi:hypothetical protein